MPSARTIVAVLAVFGVGFVAAASLVGPAQYEQGREQGAKDNEAAWREAFVQTRKMIDFCKMPDFGGPLP